MRSLVAAGLLLALVSLPVSAQDDVIERARAALSDGRYDEARNLVRLVLSRDPGNPDARHLQRRIDARTRPWSLGAGHTRDTFDDERDTWDESLLALGRDTPMGSLLVRGGRSDRFDLTDRQVEFEFSPMLRPGTVASVGVGVAQEKILYPEHRVSLDLHQSVGRGFEVSAGFRRLGFARAAHLYLAALTKHSGRWMWSVKTVAAPDGELGTAWSHHTHVRRYFGAAAHFIGAGYSHGFSREEARGNGDLIRVDGDTMRGQLEIAVTDRLRLSVSGSTSRQERAPQEPLRQSTLGGGLIIRF